MLSFKSIEAIAGQKASESADLMVLLAVIKFGAPCVFDHVFLCVCKASGISLQEAQGRISGYQTFQNTDFIQ